MPRKHKNIPPIENHSKEIIQHIQAANLKRDLSRRGFFGSFLVGAYIRQDIKHLVAPQNRMQYESALLTIVIILILTRILSTTNDPRVAKHAGVGFFLGIGASLAASLFWEHANNPIPQNSF